MFNLEDLIINPLTGAEGVWVKFYGGSELKVASTESKAYKAGLSQLAKKHKIEMEDSNPDYFEIIQEITTEALAAHVLKGWKGINLGEEQNVPYTPERGKQALLLSPVLRDFVLEKARDPATFRAAPATAPAQK
jgi:hypothetical protein